MQNLGSNVFVAVGPLVQMIRRRHAKVPDGDVPYLRDSVLRKAKWGLGVGFKFVVAPACRVGTGFIQKSRREGVIPDNRKGVVGLRVMEDLIRQSAVKEAQI